MRSNQLWRWLVSLLIAMVCGMRTPITIFLKPGQLHKSMLVQKQKLVSSRDQYVPFEYQYFRYRSRLSFVQIREMLLKLSHHQLGLFVSGYGKFAKLVDNVKDNRDPGCHDGCS